MVKLFKNLPELFRQRYLDTHEKFLKSIADITAHLYFSNYNHLEYGCEITPHDSSIICSHLFKHRIKNYNNCN